MKAAAAAHQWRQSMGALSIDQREASSMSFKYFPVSLNESGAQAECAIWCHPCPLLCPCPLGTQRKAVINDCSNSNCRSITGIPIHCCCCCFCCTTPVLYTRILTALCSFRIEQQKLSSIDCTNSISGLLCKLDCVALESIVLIGQFGSVLLALQKVTARRTEWTLAA